MSESESKSHNASRRKLNKKRQEGSIASSADLSALSATSIGLCLLLVSAPTIWDGLVENIISVNETISMPFDEAKVVAFNVVSRTLFFALIPLVGAAIGASVITRLIYNRGIVFSMKPVMPQLSRVSPQAGLKRIYGPRGWIEFFVGIVRIFVWLSFAVITVSILVPPFIASTACSIICQQSLAVPLAKYLTIGAAVALLIAGVLDALIQTNIFLTEQRMTDSELKRERKEQSVSKEVRRERNRVRNEARRENRSDKKNQPPNMCFFSGDLAIGIFYKPPDENLPRIVAKAKGAEEVAALRTEVHAAGWPEMEHATITRNGSSKNLGTSLGVEVFEEFAKVLSKLFGQNTNG